MNRAEKREMIAKAKKKEKFAKSLTPLQQEYIDEVVSAARHSAMLEMVDGMDAALTGTLIEKTDMSLDEIFHLSIQFGQYYGEIKRAQQELGVEERKMAINKIEKESIELMEELIKQGKTRAEVVKEIRSLYKGTGVTTPEINIAYKKTIERLEETEAAKKIVEILEEAEKDTTTNKNKDEKIVEIKAEHEEETEFEILKEIRIVDLKGKFGTYHVEKGIVKAEELAFTRKEEVNEWASKEREDIAKKIEELKNQMHYINSKEIETLKVFEQFM